MQFSLGRQTSRRQTSCSVCWMQRIALLTAASQLLFIEFHLIDVPERVKYKLSVMVHRCLNGRAPQYLATLCVPVLLLQWPTGKTCVLPFVISRRYRHIYGRQAFAVAGPTTWNALATHLRRRRSNVLVLVVVVDVSIAYSSTSLLQSFLEWVDGGSLHDTGWQLVQCTDNSLTEKASSHL